MYRLAYLIYGLMIASAGVTFVFLEEFGSDYGIPAWGIGLISALAFITILVTTLSFSALGDRGNLDRIGGAGIALAIAGNAWIGFATELWSISVSRALVGIGTGLFAVAARKALIGETTDGSGEKIGTLLSVAVAGFIAGPGIGAWLAEIGGIETPYLVIAVLLTVASLPALAWLRSAPIATSEQMDVGAMFALLGRPRVRLAVACQIAVFFNIGVFDSTADKYLTSLGLSNVGVGWVLVIVAAPLLVLPRIAGRLVDRASYPGRLLLAATAVLAPVVLTMGLWEALVVFTVLAVVETTMESFIFPAAARVVVDETGARESSTGQGLLDVAGQGAGAVAAIVAPTMFDLAGGPLGSFGLSGAVALVFVLYGWILIRHSARPVALA